MQSLTCYQLDWYGWLEYCTLTSLNLHTVGINKVIAKLIDGHHNCGSSLLFVLNNSENYLTDML